jgi:hypothetical protein
MPLNAKIGSSTLSSIIMFIFLFLAISSVVLADPTISIYDTPDFKRQRDCLKPCFGCFECDDLEYELGCKGALVDSCYCRSDLFGTASSFLSKCITSACSDIADVSSAISLYNGYCHVNGASLQGDLITTASTDITATAQPGATPTVIVYTTVISGSSTIINLSGESALWGLALLAFASNAMIHVLLR